MAEQMVNTDLYPISNLSSAAGSNFMRRCRRQYDQHGLCILPEFIVPEAQSLLAEEANQVSGSAYFCRSTHNAYLTDHDFDVPEDDVSRRQETTFVGSVAYDLLDEDSPLRRLYLWDPLKDFIGAVLNKKEFYRFDDPLGACSINVFVDGGEYGWHFDESEYTITLMLQSPYSGGAFEYVPGIRGLADEKERVARLLDGHREGVIELPFTTGTLLIFGGNNTLHRVTRVQGSKPRLVPVLCYSEQSGMQNSHRVRRLFWGRTGEETSVRAE